MLAPERVRGMILEMPVLDHAVEAGIVAFGPLIFVGRVTPWLVTLVRRASRLLPRSRGAVLGRCRARRPGPGARPRWRRWCTASSSAGSRRLSRLRSLIEAPAIVIGHPHDLIHPAADAAMLAGELPNARFVEARSILEWRMRPERIDAEVLTFLADVCSPPARRPRRRAATKGTMGT